MKMMSKKKTKTSIKYLPLEIWTLILSRMPGKTLLRFRSVCKPWCSIIDDPNFAHLHLQLCNMNNNNKNKLFVAYNGGKRRSMEIRRADTFRKTGHNLTSFKIYGFSGSCNGLLLMLTNVDTKQELRLWNPSIRKSLLIPPCPIPSHLHHLTRFVFGYAPSTKEYKILAITVDETAGGTHPIDKFLTVYTLSDQRWTVRNNGLINIDESWLKRIFWSCSYSSNCVFFQGAVHTIGKNLYNDNKDHLVSIDFDSEKFTFTELPYVDDKSYTLWFPLIIGESIAVFSITSQNNASIWALKLDGGNKVWTLRFRLGVFDFRLFFNKNSTTTKVFYYESDYGDCLIIGKKSYHLASGEVQERGKSTRKLVGLETYLESLVLHKGYGAQDDVDIFPVN